MPTSKLLRYHYIETLLNIDGLDEISTPNVRILKEDKNISVLLQDIWSEEFGLTKELFFPLAAHYASLAKTKIEI